MKKTNNFLYLILITVVHFFSFCNTVFYTQQAFVFHLLGEKDYYKPVKAGNFWNNNYIKYESNGNIKNHISQMVPNWIRNINER